MKKWLWRTLHQSYIVVFLCVGIIVGVVLGLVLRVNYFASPAWIWFAGLILVGAYLKPRLAFVALAFVAGMMIAFFRVTGELAVQDAMGQVYKVTAGLETEEWVVSVRDWFAAKIEGVMPEPQVGLGLSYLLGMKTGLPDDLSEQLRMVGLVHIVVASGAHLSILVEVARRVFGRASRTFGLVCSILFVVFFMAMVGWTPSILRAGLMAILTLVGWYVGRKIAPLRMILMVAAVTLILNPMFVVDLGWLLSFASFGGIMILGPRMTKFFYGERRPGFVGATVLTTLSATLMTLPIILYYFGQISLISVVANLLILPTLSYAMGLVFMTGVCAGLPVVETVVAWCATRILDFHIVVVGWLSGMEQFLVKIDRYQPGVFWIYLVIVVPVLIGLIKQKMVKLREAKYKLE